MGFGELRQVMLYAQSIELLQLRRSRVASADYGHRYKNKQPTNQTVYLHNITGGLERMGKVRLSVYIGDIWAYMGTVGDLLLLLISNKTKSSAIEFNFVRKLS